MGGFYTGHHIYIHRCIYTYIYTFFDLFSDQIHHQSHEFTTTHFTPVYRALYHHQSPPKKFFHRFPHEFTIFHKISPSKNTKKHQNPQNREKPEKTVFLGVPPHPPKNPYFPGFSGPPKLHKFAQICTNLHQFAPPKHHFWGVPNLPGPSG